MAKTAKVAAQRRRRAIVAQYAARRAELKQLARTAGSHDERLAALRALAGLPRDASLTRLRNRDVVDGRPRGFVRIAGVSRLRFREMVHAGELPGITKSSW